MDMPHDSTFDTSRDESRTDEDGESGIEEGLLLPRTYTDGSAVHIEDELGRDERFQSSVSDLPADTKHEVDEDLEELLRIDSVTSRDILISAIERQFNFDAVTCYGEWKQIVC